MDAAMKLARRERPEVMLINLDLAAVGAVALMKILRSNPATQATPILALALDAAAGRLTEALDYALEFTALERAE